MRNQTAKFLRKLQKAKSLHSDNDLKRFWHALSHKEKGAFKSVVQPHLEKSQPIHPNEARHTEDNS